MNFDEFLEQEVKRFSHGKNAPYERFALMLTTEPSLSKAWFLYALTLSFDTAQELYTSFEQTKCKDPHLWKNSILAEWNSLLDSYSPKMATSLRNPTFEQMTALGFPEQYAKYADNWHDGNKKLSQVPQYNQIVRYKFRQLYSETLLDTLARQGFDKETLERFYAEQCDYPLSELKKLHFSLKEFSK